MRNLDQWLFDYSLSHQNPVNQKIHKVCVPLIFFSILGMLWDWNISGLPAAVYVAILGMIFYMRLGIKAVTLMLIQLSMCFAILHYWSQNSGNIFFANLVIFILAWIGQFVGHKIEGQKPSFFEDLQFLLIGPLWVFSFAFKK